MNRQMTDSELGAILSEAMHDAVIYSGEFLEENEEALKYYNAELFGDEVEGQSKVVKTDVADVIDADMVSLTRVFLGAKNICTFQPYDESEESIQEAQDKTKYINYLVRHRPTSFRLIFDWLKGAGIHDYSVLKYYAEEKKTKIDENYSGLSVEEIAPLVIDYDEKDYSLEQDDNGDYDLTITKNKASKEIAIHHVPLESFLINRNASDIESAELVGDRLQKTRGELLSEGYDRDIINRIPKVEIETRKQGTLKQVRFEQEGGEDIDNLNDWASEVVEITNLFVLVDFDGDGIAERRNVTISGNVVLDNEPYDHVPYAPLTAYPMMHKAIGQSRASKVMETQKVNSVLLRQGLNNLYHVNNPKTFISDDVDVDDLLSDSIGGYVGVGNGNPQLSAFPLTITPTFESALTGIQYMDQLRANTTGGLQASQGLSADDVANETATRFAGVQAESAGKVELLARIYAETGFRKLYEGLAWTAKNYQDDDLEVMVGSSQVKIKPSQWRGDPVVIVESSLGMSDRDQANQTLTGILGIQRELLQNGSPLADSAKVYNLLDDLCKVNDAHRTSRYFNDPEQPDQLLRAENELLRRNNQQLQQTVQQSQNPLKEAEEIRAQAKLIEAQSKLQIEQQKMQLKQQEDLAKYNQENSKLLANVALKLTELEMKFGTDSKAVFDGNT